MKPIGWIDNSLEDLKKFPDKARKESGFQIYNIQQGEEPDDWKPMPSIGQGVNEIRIHTENEYRIIYVAKFADAVYVLHVFQKKTRKTSQNDISISKLRYKKLINWRRKQL